MCSKYVRCHSNKEEDVYNDMGYLVRCAAEQIRARTSGETDDELLQAKLHLPRAGKEEKPITMIGIRRAMY